QRAAQRGQSNAAGNHHHIAPAKLLDWPTAAERTADSEYVSTFEFAHRLGHRAHNACGVHKRFASRVGANRDWDFANAKNIQHIDLPRREPERLVAVRRLDLESESVQRFASPLLDAKWLREHRIDARHLVVFNNHFLKCFQYADLQFVGSMNAEIQSREWR